MGIGRRKKGTRRTWIKSEVFPAEEGPRRRIVGRVWMVGERVRM